MEFTKTELSALFSSTDLRVSWAPRDLTPIHNLTKAQLVATMNKGVVLNPKMFFYAVSFLLSKEKEYGYIMNGLGVYIKPRCPDFDYLFGSSVYLVNLDDDGTYWCPTERGLERKCLTEWIGRQACVLESSIIVNFDIESMKNKDPRMWIVFDLKDGKKFQRKDYLYQTSKLEAHEYIMSVDRMSQEVKSIVPDYVRPRLIYPQIRPIPSRVDMIFTEPSPIRPNSSGSIGIPPLPIGSLKRSAPIFENPDNKRQRTD